MLNNMRVGLRTKEFIFEGLMHATNSYDNY